MAISELHGAVEKTVLRLAPPADGRSVLDAGAGRGAFSHRLSEAGYRVAACDVHPELFELPETTFRVADISREIPWPDDSFDVVVALEVVEHIESVQLFFSEARRVLRDDGLFVFSTPNILSLKSRLRFLMSGHFYSFGPIAESEVNAVEQHISPLPLHLYDFRLRATGFELVAVETDIWQRSSLGWLVLYPVIALRNVLARPRNKGGPNNAPTLLLGRQLIVAARCR